MGEGERRRGQGTHGLSPTPRNASSTPFMAATAAAGGGRWNGGGRSGEQKQQAGNGSSLHSRLQCWC